MDSPTQLAIPRVKVMIEGYPIFRQTQVDSEPDYGLTTTS